MNVHHLDAVPTLLVNEELCIKKLKTGIERGTYRFPKFSKQSVAPAKTIYTTSYEKNEYPRSVFNKRSVSFDLESSIIKKKSANGVENSKNRTSKCGKISANGLVENIPVCKKKSVNGLENALCQNVEIPYVDANLLNATKPDDRFSLKGSNENVVSGVYGHSLLATVNKIFKVTTVCFNFLLYLFCPVYFQPLNRHIINVL